MTADFAATVRSALTDQASDWLREYPPDAIGLIRRIEYQGHVWHRTERSARARPRGDVSRPSIGAAMALAWAAGAARPGAYECARCHARAPAAIGLAADTDDGRQHLAALLYGQVGWCRAPGEEDPYDMLESAKRIGRAHYERTGKLCDPEIEAWSRDLHDRAHEILQGGGETLRVTW